jgi:hypothetical protein
MSTVTNESMDIDDVEQNCFQGHFQVRTNYHPTETRSPSFPLADPYSEQPSSKHLHHSPNGFSRLYRLRLGQSYRKRPLFPSKRATTPEDTAATYQTANTARLRTPCLRKSRRPSVGASPDQAEYTANTSTSDALSPGETRARLRHKRVDNGIGTG